MLNERVNLKWVFWVCENLKWVFDFRPKASFFFCFLSSFSLFGGVETEQ